MKIVLLCKQWFIGYHAAESINVMERVLEYERGKNS